MTALRRCWCCGEQVQLDPSLVPSRWIVDEQIFEDELGRAWCESCLVRFASRAQGPELPDQAPPAPQLAGLAAHARERLVGATCIGVEYAAKDGPNSGGEEVHLDFGGPELLVYVNAAGAVVAEVD